MKIDVLNAGYIELVRSMGGDEAIAESARICFQSEAKTPKADENLIKMLVKEGHTSPLEHCVMTFKVKAPIFVLRQWMRHRVGMSYSELSLRYCEAKPEFYVPTDEKYKAMYYSDMAEQFKTYLFYKEMYEKDGVSPARARELARPFLPLGIYSEMIWTVNGASAFHFLDLRSSDHSQEEIRVYADAFLQLAKTVAFITFSEKERLMNG